MFCLPTESCRSRTETIWHLEDSARAFGKKARLAPPLPDCSRLHFPGRQDSPHDRCIQLVFSLADIPGLVFHAQDEHRQSSLFVEILFGDRYRQNFGDAVFAVGGFVAMLARVPCENADLIEIIVEAIVRLG